jgi:hypothetical protein
MVFIGWWEPIIDLWWGNEWEFLVEISCDDGSKKKFNELLVQNQKVLMDCLVTSWDKQRNFHPKWFPWWLISKFASVNKVKLYGKDRSFNPYRFTSMSTANNFIKIVNWREFEWIKANLR